VKKTVIWIAALGILGAALLFLEYRFLTEKQIERELSLAASLEEALPGGGETLLSMMFRAEPDEPQGASGRELLARYGYTEKGEAILRERSVAPGFWPVAIAIVLLLALTFFAVGLTLRRDLQERSRAESEVLKLRNELAETAALKDVNQRLRDFIENIAHQIKTPIAGCLMSMELLEEEAEDTAGGSRENSGEKAAGEDLSESMEESAEEGAKRRIRECVDRLNDISALIGRLLNIGRLEAGEVMFSGDRVDLREMVRDAAEDFAAVKPYELDSMPETGDFTALLSAEWTGEALSNLIKNCTEHDTSEKPLELSLKSEKDWVRLIIRDHGPGFDEEDLPYIFDRFYQPKNSRKGHVGLGLNLARLIIEGQKGRITAENAKEGGAQFTVLLPRLAMLK